MAWLVRGSGVLSSRRVAQTRADVEAYRWWARGLTLVEVAERVGYADASGAQRAVARVEALCEVDDRALLVRLEWLCPGSSFLAQV